MNRIFVYGLLKPGFSLHHVARPYVVRAVEASVTGRLYDAGVPAARFDQPGEIEGVLFEIDPDRVSDALAVLDELEDEGTEYRRVTVDVRVGATSVKAYAYEYLPPLDGRPMVGRAWLSTVEEG